MTNYWSCTKFANWLRGTEKPSACTGKGWDDWRKVASKAHPFRYWLAESALDKIQSFLKWPLDKIYAIKYYINNRWVTKTHALTASAKDITPGNWCDVGNRFLPCLFNELVDFVEIETAWQNIAWDKDSRGKYKPPFWATGWFRWRTWRCPEAGIDHLNWAASLKFDEEWMDKNDPEYGKPTPQAKAAKETLELYSWWKEIYPRRIDCHEQSGWDSFCARRRAKIQEQDPAADEILFLDVSTYTEEEQEESRRILALTAKIEQAQQDEDTEMLIRLIKIRNNLWT